MVVERLSLDVEGGVGERRTRRSETAGVGEVLIENRTGKGGHEHEHGHGAKEKGVAKVEVRVDEGAGVVASAEISTTTMEKPKPKKERKKVAFRSDKPDLYDF